jgi:DNA-binding response OmpR family regulator
MIADDDAQIRDLLKLYFTKEGFAIAEAADGAERSSRSSSWCPAWSSSTS